MINVKNLSKATKKWCCKYYYYYTTIRVKLEIVIYLRKISTNLPSAKNINICSI